MGPYDDLADSVVLKIKRNKVSIIDKHPTLVHIGTGRSAAVFKMNATNKALKIFFPSHEHIALEEAEIYRKLQGIPFYPALYEAGKNYIVIDYIQGNTLFNCLTHGVRIKEPHIQEVDRALFEARKVGLTPSDVHLRNIILTSDGNIKLIDVARFQQTNGCKQWEDLKKAYKMFYIKKYFPKRFPAFLLNIIARLYNKNLLRLSNYEIKKKSSVSIKNRIRKSP